MPMPQYPCSTPLISDHVYIVQLCKIAIILGSKQGKTTVTECKGNKFLGPNEGVHSLKYLVVAVRRLSDVLLGVQFLHHDLVGPVVEFVDCTRGT